MYYFTKFCRICIQTGVKLLDIDTVDFDSVRLSEKLEICMKMVVSKESLSTEICLQCIKKLRISYDFQNMCKKSTKILEGYLNELISTSNKIDPNSFINSELRVTLTPVSKNAIHRKRKRITKEQRCSLLKKLLLTRDKIDKDKIKIEEVCCDKYTDDEVYKGGLKSILNFTKNFDFGYDFENKSENNPLKKLTEFSNNFFTNNFTQFKETILYIIENKNQYLYDSDEDDEEMFETEITDDDENMKEIKFEEVIVEPDIKIKCEIEYEDCNSNDCSENYNETSCNNNECKREIEYECINKKESSLSNLTKSCDDAYQYLRYNSQTCCSSMEMLNKLVGNFSTRKTFSQHSVRCRTRGNPYINPQLRQQFQMRSFKCSKCNRYFKSPGYLKAHDSKVH